jgi:chaperone modulatory protein CbpM
MNQPQQTKVDPASDLRESLTLDDLCRTCAVQASFLTDLLEEGVIEPIEGHSPDDWRFTSVQVQHVSVAWRLHRDLGVNPAGTAVVLQLLEEVQTLRAELGRQAPSTDDS